MCFSKRAFGFRGIYCPIPTKRNPHVAEADINSITWAESHGLIYSSKMRHQLRRFQIADFIARAYPEESLPVLQILVDWGIWILLADDQQDTYRFTPDQLASIYRDYIEVLQGANITSYSSPMCSALLSLRERILMYSSQVCLERLIYAVEEWFVSLIQECRNQATDNAPDLLTYTELRQISICMYPYYALYDLSHGGRFPDQFWYHPTLQEMMRECANIIGWINDVFSYFKERALGDVHNMVFILERDYGYSTEQAIDETIKRHNSKMEQFIKIDAMFANNEPALYHEVSPFIKMLQNWMRANLDWSLDVTQRYGSLNSQNFRIVSTIEASEHDRLVS